MDTKPACKTTHRQLIAGACPWCGEHVAGEDVSKTADRVWNAQTLEADLDDPDVEVRMMTTTNLHLHNPPVDLAVSLLAKALNNSDLQVRQHAGHALLSLGSNLSSRQATDFESRVSRNEHETALRLALSGYYTMGQYESKQARIARRDHILWLIENAAEVEACGCPECQLNKHEDPEGYRQAKELWLAAVENSSDNANILANAARFFTLNDRKISEQLLMQGSSLQPEEHHWQQELGQLYSLEARRNEEHDQPLATKSFAAYEAAERARENQQLDDPQGEDKVQSILSRIYALPDLARSALDAFEFESAANYASELLSLAKSSELPEYFRDNGNAVHYGNFVLGCVALERGDIESAKLRLLASGKTKGSPNLMSFGPNMALAKDLLERGQREVVLQYFRLCAEFWEHGAEELEDWTRQVQSGKIPDFGANLVY